MREARIAAFVLVSLVLSTRAHAQDEELAVPPPPPAQPTPPGAPPATPRPAIDGVPLDVVVAPLVAAAEADLGAGRVPLALARTSVVAEVLPEGLPLRVRADGLRLLAQQRLPRRAPTPAVEEVYAPMIAQADLDLRAGQPQLALARLDFVLARLPAGSPLAARARQLRGVAASYLGAPPVPAGPPPVAARPPPAAPVEPPPGQGPPGNHRGVGEIIELYITAAGFGALTGGYIPFAASANTATGATYLLTSVAGAGLLAVGVLTLDLTAQLPSGLPPTVSSSIRFGFANGLLAWGMYEATTVGDRDPNVSFSLVWGGALTGTVAGLAIGFGLTPSVREARFVESAGLWGAALGTYIAMITNYDDPAVGFGLTMGGLDLGLLVGVAMAALEAIPSLRRTLWIDLGFLIGSGVGALIPALYYSYEDSDPIEAAPFGVGMLLGAIGGWVLTYFLTEGMDAPPAPSAPPLTVGIAPVEGGAALSLGGVF